MVGRTPTSTSSETTERIDVGEASGISYFSSDQDGSLDVKAQDTGRAINIIANENADADGGRGNITIYDKDGKRIAGIAGDPTPSTDDGEFSLYTKDDPISSGSDSLQKRLDVGLGSANVDAVWKNLTRWRLESPTPQIQLRPGSASGDSSIDFMDEGASTVWRLLMDRSLSDRLAFFVLGTGTALDLKTDLSVSTGGDLTVGGDIDINPTDTYSLSNVTTDRTFDANSTTTAELADVLATLIQDLGMGA